MTNTNEIRVATESWVNSSIKKEFDPIDINDVYAAFEAGANWQSRRVQGEVVAYYDPRPGVDWECRFLEPDVIEQEDNRKFYTVPLIANQPAPAAVPDEAFNIIEGIRAELTWPGWRSARSRDWVMDSLSELLSMLTASPAPEHSGDGNEMVTALRQYRHNDGGGFVFAYDKEQTDRIVTGLVKALETIEAYEIKSSPTATDFGLSFDRSMWIGGMQEIARAALAEYRQQGEAER